MKAKTNLIEWSKTIFWVTVIGITTGLCGVALLICLEMALGIYQPLRPAVSKEDVHNTDQRLNTSCAENAQNCEWIFNYAIPLSVCYDNIRVIEKDKTLDKDKQETLIQREIEESIHILNEWRKYDEMRERLRS